MSTQFGSPHNDIADCWELPTIPISPSNQSVEPRLLGAPNSEPIDRDSHPGVSS